MGIANLRRTLPTPVVALVASMVVLGLVVGGKPLFMTNDDAAIAMVGAGFGIAARPEAHLVFAHYGYGLLIEGVSKVVGPAAHGWLTLASLAISLSLLLGAVIRTPFISLDRFLLASTLVVIMAMSMLEPQFTLTAALLFASSIAYAFSSADCDRRSMTNILLIGFAMTMSLLFRPASFVASIVVSGPVLVFLSWQPGRFRGTARALLIAIASIGALGAVADWLAYAVSDGWSQALRYAYLRGQFTDFGRVPWIDGAAAYRDAGWNHDDYDMFMDWYTQAPIYSLSIVASIVQEVGISPTTFNVHWLYDWFAYPFHSPSVLLGLTVQTCLMLAAPARWRLSALLIVGEIAAVALAAFTGRPPGDRVWLSIADIALIGAASLVLTQSDSPRLKMWSSVPLLLAFVFTIYDGIELLSVHRQRLSAARDYRLWIDAHRDFFAGKVVSWGGATTFEWLVTPTRVYFPLPQTTMASIGGLSSTPITPEALKKIGVSDFTHALCTATDLHVISTASYMTTLAGFCERHEGVTPHYREIATFTPSTLCESSGPATVSMPAIPSSKSPTQSGP